MELHEPMQRGEPKKKFMELPQDVRTAKNNRWSEIHYKLAKREFFSPEEETKLKAEKEELQREITE